MIFPYKTRSILPLLSFTLQSQFCWAFLVMQFQYSFWVCMFTFTFRLRAPTFLHSLELGSSKPVYQIPWDSGVPERSLSSNGDCKTFFFLRSCPTWLRALHIYQLCEDWWFILPDNPKADPIRWSGRTGRHSCPAGGRRRRDGRWSHRPFNW